MSMSTSSTCPSSFASLCHYSRSSVFSPFAGILSCIGHKSTFCLTEWDDRSPETIWLTQPWINLSSLVLSFTVWVVWLGLTSSLKVLLSTRFFQTWSLLAFQPLCGSSHFNSFSRVVWRTRNNLKLNTTIAESFWPHNTKDWIHQLLRKV